MKEPTNLIPLPERCYINLTHPSSSRLTWRSVGIVLGRVAALPNLTDMFLSQAQFNLLSARFTPRPLQPLMMTSGLQVILANLAYVETDCDSGQTTLQRPQGGLCELAKALGELIPRPAKLSRAESSKLEEIRHAATITALNQLSRRSLTGPTLPLATTIKPKSPEMAAMDWAEAMESYVSSLSCGSEAAA
ncbi:hypothetical protein SAMN04488518_11385 [Pseudovibrio ascidiaceicola]|uniref:Uncharacterized protein n=1 Tax=Pseudovibrio ascidiaceicola TaxID=285279 RepID=A0A1I4DZ23_9HYPH|nr:hypothetical protein [Pseudovibrio ascidiaceicola]SFK98868.1 hypothetical protein SAMN04488518_11385 [Pseudovibrio ascidiaceicola]